ncbi:MAG TPA: GreA/GreB family elongation factor [Patescibacteria group bacterium]|nr:GreA/GreB family elongation factor [Patescibacteria group bacterium]
MRVPIRGGDPRLFHKKDYYISPAKYRELEEKLKRMLIKRPIEAIEVKRLAEMGDFSENAGYQLAKGRLRGLNQRILDTEDMLKKAEIIEVNHIVETVQVGHFVTLESKNEKKTYQILGGSESNPNLGIISHLSPLGSALLNKKLNDVVRVGIPGKEKEYKIIMIKA